MNAMNNMKKHHMTIVAGSPPPLVTSQALQASLCYTALAVCEGEGGNGMALEFLREQER